MCHRTHQFYLTVEQALLCGDPLLVEGVATPLDPALQPLLEMLHSWNSNGMSTLRLHDCHTVLNDKSCTSLPLEPNSIRFCGRNVQANPRFSLFLTTSVPLSLFPPTLTCIVCPVDFSPSQPWVKELLYRTACGEADSPSHFHKVSSNMLSTCMYMCVQLCNMSYGI